MPGLSKRPPRGAGTSVRSGRGGGFSSSSSPPHPASSRPAATAQNAGTVLTRSAAPSGGESLGHRPRRLRDLLGRYPEVRVDVLVRARLSEGLHADEASLAP